LVNRTYFSFGLQAEIVIVLKFSFVFMEAIFKNTSIYLFIYLFKLFIYLRESEPEREYKQGEQWREREQQSEREKQAPRAAGSLTQGLILKLKADT